jgi:hypothetical protein
MSEAYLMSMPIIINCLGGEMIYILCSRLKAQKINTEKSTRVIKDIGNVLFNKKFQTELYIHKKPYFHQEIKSIFESFVHASIMRLNTTSMNKLFELMLMTLKLQILRTRYPEEIYQITLNHYLGLIEILHSIENEDNSLLERIKEEMEIFQKTYSKLSSYDYIILKSVILRFLQGKNVKVSIFIQDFLQDSNSIIYIPMNEESPPFVEKLGIIKNIDNGKEYFFELKLNDCYKGNNNNNRMANFNTEFGKNMYKAEKLKLIGRNKNQKNNNNEIKSENENTYNVISNKDNEKKKIQNSVFGNNYQENELSDEQKKLISQGKKKDLNLFASMFTSQSNDDELFQFDLFGINDETKADEGKNEEDFINIERSNNNNNIKNKMNEIFNLDDAKEDEDDLLDLIDKNN